MRSAAQIDSAHPDCQNASVTHSAHVNHSRALAHAVARRARLPTDGLSTDSWSWRVEASGFTDRRLQPGDLRQRRDGSEYAHVFGMTRPRNTLSYRLGACLTAEPFDQPHNLPPRIGCYPLPRILSCSNSCWISLSSRPSSRRSLTNFCSAAFTSSAKRSRSWACSCT
jgi:hypothetical protein